MRAAARAVAPASGAALLVLTLALVPPRAQAAPSPVAAGKAPMPRRALTDAELQRDTPPPTAYDLSATEAPTLPPEDHTLLVAVGRTIAALALVLALVYVFAKVLLPRLGRGLPGGARGRMRVLDRLSLDRTHSVVLLELEDGAKILLGTGNGTVTPLRGVTRMATASFGQHLGDAMAPPPDTREQHVGDN